MINFKNSKYIKSAPDITFSPNLNKPEILLVGKSNVGKSSLLNAICKNKNLAKVSSTPGYTKYLNYFLIDDSFYIIDAPGYGFKINKDNDFDKMMNSIFKSKLLKGVVFILDSRRLLSEDDKVFYNNLIDYNLPFFIVLSKADKINQKEKNQIIQDIKSNFKFVKENEVIFTSSLKKTNLDEVTNRIVKIISNK